LGKGERKKEKGTFLYLSHPHLGKSIVIPKGHSPLRKKKGKWSRRLGNYHGEEKDPVLKYLLGERWGGGKRGGFAEPLPRPRMLEEKKHF